MNHLSLKLRLLLVGVLPCLCIVITLLLLVNTRMHRVLDNDLTVLRETLIEAHKTELRHSLDIAKTLIKPMYEVSERGDTDEKSQAIELLSRAFYGQDGYYFGYDGNSVRVFSGSDSARIGDSFKDYKDVNNVYLINDLVARAKEGGGFVTYHFPRQGDATAYPKLSYSIWLEKWNLMIGTGFYIDSIDASVAQASAQSQAYIQSTLWQIIYMGIFLTIISTLITYWVINQSLRPLNGLIKSLQIFAQGGGDLTRRLIKTSNDEIGTLIGTFNQFVESIHHMIKRVQETSLQMTDNSDQLAKITAENFKILDSQREETLQVASAINQLSAAAVQVAQSSQEVSNAVVIAEKSSVEAQKTSHESIQNVQALSNDVRHKMESLDKLKEDVRGISAISSVIRAIAEQTNLLALNASIEAARAGEQGRGFAVVADEVRALAARTQASTQEIQEKTNQLALSTNAVSESINRSLLKGDVSVSKASATAESLIDIQQKVSLVNEQSLQIVAATEEQSQVIESINASIHSIAEATELANKHSADSFTAGEAVAKIGDELRLLVSEFKT